MSLESAAALGYAGFDSAEAIAAYRAAIDRAGAERADARRGRDGRADQRELGRARAFLARREGADRAASASEELAGGFASDFLRALLAHFEVRRGVDRARAAELARGALAGGTLENESTQGIYYALDALRAAGELDAALAGYASALAAARRRGDLLNVGGLLGFRGWLLLDRGDLRAAEPDVRESIEFSAEHGDAGARHVQRRLPLRLPARAGRSSTRPSASLARTGLRRASCPRTSTSRSSSARAAGSGSRSASRRRRSPTSTALRRIAEQARARRTRPSGRGGRAPRRPCSRSAAHDEAHELAAEELELARRWGDAAADRLRAARRSASIEGGAAGEAAAARGGRGARAVDRAARAREDAGRARRRAPAPERAQRGARAARAGRRAREPLRRRRARRRAATRSSPRRARGRGRSSLTGLDSLTASERRVAQLAAEELSNKEIAQALFVTVKTVEVHLSNVYRKLEIGSRRAASRPRSSSRSDARGPA